VVRLSPREHQLLSLYLQVGRLKPVAQSLGVSIATAKIQKSSLMRKLGASNTVELMHAAIKRGLIDPKKEERRNDADDAA
jgi:DNA-binding NarL/FixJ family response regulator